MVKWVTCNHLISVRFSVEALKKTMHDFLRVVSATRFFYCK